MTPTEAPRRRRRPSILLAVLAGLGGGLLLSAPLARLLQGEGFGAADQLVNPFSRWASIASQDVVVLGTDVGGGNTDVMTVLRVRNGVTPASASGRRARLHRPCPAPASAMMKTRLSVVIRLNPLAH